MKRVRAVLARLKAWQVARLAAQDWISMRCMQPWPHQCRDALWCKCPCHQEEADQ